MSSSKINNTLFLIFGQGINFLFNLLMLPILVRTLPLDDYASYSQIVLITSTLYPIISLGIGNGMIVFFNEDRRHNFNVVLNGITGVFVISLVAYILLYFSSGQLTTVFKNELIWHYLSFFFFSIILQIISDLFFNFLIFIEKSKTASFLVVLNNLLRLSAMFLAIYFTKDIFYIFLFQMIAQAIGISIYFGIIYFTFVKDLFFRYDFDLNKKMIGVSVPLALTSIVGVLLIQTDGFIINSFLGKFDFAYYRTGAIEIPFLSTIYASISLIFLPEFKKLVTQKDWSEIILLKRKLILNSAIITYPFILLAIFFGKDLIIWYLGSDFTQSASIFIIYNLILFIRVNDYSDILILHKKSTLILFIYVVSFFINLALSLILVNTVGILGPLIATVFSIFVIATLQLRYTSKILNTNVIYFSNLYKVVGVLVFDIAVINISYGVFYFFPVNKLIEIGVTGVCFISLHFYMMHKLRLIDQSIVDKVKFVIQKYGIRKFFL